MLFKQKDIFKNGSLCGQIIVRQVERWTIGTYQLCLSIEHNTVADKKITFYKQFLLVCRTYWGSETCNLKVRKNRCINDKYLLQYLQYLSFNCSFIMHGLFHVKHCNYTLAQLFDDDSANCIDVHTLVWLF